MKNIRSNDLNKIRIVILTSIVIFSLCCQNKKHLENKCELLTNSLLGKALSIPGSRDGMYAAYVYLSKCEPSDMPPYDSNIRSLTEWEEYGKILYSWLESQDISRVKELIDGFPEFMKTWSPVFFPGDDDTVQEN